MPRGLARDEQEIHELAFARHAGRERRSDGYAGPDRNGIQAGQRQARGDETVDQPVLPGLLRLPRVHRRPTEREPPALDRLARRHGTWNGRCVLGAVGLLGHGASLAKMELAVPPTSPAGAPPPRLRPPTPRVALVIVASMLLGLVILVAASAVKPFLLGALLVYLLAPLVEWIARFGVPRGLAVLFVFVGVVAVIVLVATLALTPLIQQLRLFVGDLPEIAAGLRTALERSYADLRLPDDMRDVIDGFVDDAGRGLGGLDLGALVSPLVSLVGAITAYAILPAWLFFLLKDRLRLTDALERALPVGWRGDVFAVLAVSNRVFGMWIRGQVILGGVVGIATFIGLIGLSIWVDPIFGRYAVLLSIFAAVMELVPFIGPIIAAIPAVLIGLIVGPAPFLAALLLYLAIQQLENHILVPKIQGNAVELHPSAVLFALVVGASLGGILGAIVSLPIAAAARDIFRFLFHRLSDPPASVDEALRRVSERLPGAVRRSAVDAGASGWPAGGPLTVPPATIGPGVIAPRPPTSEDAP